MRWTEGRMTVKCCSNGAMSPFPSVRARVWFLRLKKKAALGQDGRMKLQAVSKVLFAVAAILFFQACATTAPTSGIAALTGTWTNSLGTVLTAAADGSFEVDLDHDGKRDAWGKNIVEGNTVTIVGTGGVVPKGCAKTKGRYNFTRTKNTLRFTLINDPCKLRVKNVTLDWTRK
jgi:hypothetical protein